NEQLSMGALMQWHRHCVVIVGLLALPTAVQAQQSPQAAPPPLFVRLAGPPGMRVTIYRGGPHGESLGTPCVVAFRPGYRYRIELADLSEHLRPKAAASVS